MDKLEVALKIKELGNIPTEHRKGASKNTGWYQEVNLLGNLTTTNRGSDIKTFRRIVSLMDFPVFNYRILDLGCNAGLYCVEGAILGMTCVGIEQKKIWLDQAKFVKQCYEHMLGKSLDVHYILDNLPSMTLINLGNFDYVLALGVLSELLFSEGHARDSSESIEAQSNLLSKLKLITENIMIRSLEGFSSSGKVRYVSELDGFELVDEVEEGLGRRILRFRRSH
ncbi:MAG: hypothetical protein KAW09_04675 [Thermoplasmata archaeon]|nr:hypothetical protein [Thermoplasmata archaeon]